MTISKYSIFGNQDTFQGVETGNLCGRARSVNKGVRIKEKENELEAKE